MEGSYPSKLRIYDGAAAALIQDLAGLQGAGMAQGAPQGPAGGADYAERLHACESLVPASGKGCRDEGPEPYSLQWFLDIEARRHGRQGRWIPRLLEFAKHSGETLLGLGHGLGTDWLQYARHGAGVVVCSPSNTQLALVRRNFELRG